MLLSKIVISMYWSMPNNDKNACSNKCEQCRHKLVCDLEDEVANQKM